ncbi:cuticle protein 16.5-like [Anthonomus grandis grandis]|uniref:cuticle protein 16.5-like n=1 Tax=Anthonomus grandis grandis TaxID=2921223 RepID=UPI0021665974|nr:cuticle protein 16.5-like [Anthonomus grandis grandis]
MFFKTIVFFAVLAVALAVPAPEAKADPKAKPWLAYSAPLVASAPVAYSAAYSAPLTYAAAPLAYSAYPAYSAYASPYVAAVL